jgi:hypothetical protein
MVQRGQSGVHYHLTWTLISGTVWGLDWDSIELGPMIFVFWNQMWLNLCHGKGDWLWDCDLRWVTLMEGHFWCHWLWDCDLRWVTSMDGHFSSYWLLRCDSQRSISMMDHFSSQWILDLMCGTSAQVHFPLILSFWKWHCLSRLDIEAMSHLCGPLNLYMWGCELQWCLTVMDHFWRILNFWNLGKGDYRSWVGLWWAYHFWQALAPLGVFWIQGSWRFFGCWVHRTQYVVSFWIVWIRTDWDGWWFIRGFHWTPSPCSFADSRLETSFPLLWDKKGIIISMPVGECLCSEIGGRWTCKLNECIEAFICGVCRNLAIVFISNESYCQIN